MKILIATPEAVPFAKTGGLADVTGALLAEFNKMSEDAYLILPLYKRIRESFRPKDTGIKISVPLGGRNVTGAIYKYKTSAYFIRCDEFFDREELYGTPAGDYPDNALRFVFFSRGILETCKAVKLKPDVIHCHDWQAGLVPVYLKTLYRSDEFFGNAASVITVHNIGYQGLFPQSEMQTTGLDASLFNPEGMEFYGKINFLKAGLVASDLITTVSDNYAKEILTDEYGFGLDGVLKRRASRLSGIINGINYNEWDPASDIHIAARYSLKNIAGKKKCKLRLMRDCSMKPYAGAPLLGMVGRLSAQKGIDIVLDSIKEMLSAGVNLVILGKGDESYYARLNEAAARHKGRLYVKIGFEDALAHKIYAGSDIFLMPSRYEPCGLGQLVAMRYGTIPVARRTGGLADTVMDYEPLTGKGTGFLFSEYTPSALLNCIKMALCAYADKNRWRDLALNAMKMDFSWSGSAKKYIEIYKKALELKRQ